jgi:hypothetical protein
LTNLLPEIGVRGGELVASWALNRKVVLRLRDIGARFIVSDEGSLLYVGILYYFFFREREQVLFARVPRFVLRELVSERLTGHAPIVDMINDLAHVMMSFNIL